MKRFVRSIRWRLLGLAAVGTVIVMTIAGLGLAALFERHLERRVGQELDAIIAQLAGNVVVQTDGRLNLRAEPSDPRFQRPLSGYYWQVRDEATPSVVLRARSLWDSDLQPTDDGAEIGRRVSHVAVAPNGKSLLQHDRRLVLATGGGGRAVTISAAIERSEIETLRAGFVSDLAPGLAILALLILIGAWFQVGAGLRPLARLRDGVADIRTGTTSRLDIEGPEETAPLVAELNGLLDAQEREMVKARDRAADLAHGLRTPLTALAGDVERLRRVGASDIAADVASVGEQMRRVVERELARARSRHASGKTIWTLLRPVAASVARTLERTPDGERLTIAVYVPEDLRFPLPPEDLAEVLGNLTENAVRAAKLQVKVSGNSDPASSLVWISIEDDGLGADVEAMEELSRRGERADRAGGAGLGLAIVGDILEAHGAGVTFARSSLGGLHVKVVAKRDDTTVG